MAQKGVGNTALGAAVCRLIEQYEPDDIRLFDDRVVARLVGAAVRLMVGFAGMRKYIVKQTDATMNGIYGAQVCRARYDDDVVRAAAEKGIDQVVILGAGYDTRPYRLSGMEHVKFFEVDLPAVQEGKKKKLRKYLRRLPDNVVFLPIDFSSQTLDSVLGGSMFSSSRPAVFVCEGVTQYLSEADVKKTLSYVGSCAPGSLIVFTYVLRSIIERRSGIPGADKMLDWVATNNAAWSFGLDPATLGEYLRPYHLRLVEDAGSAEYLKRYLEPLKRQLIVSEGERIATAVVEGG